MVKYIIEDIEISSDESDNKDPMKKFVMNKILIKIAILNNYRLLSCWSLVLKDAFLKTSS